MSITQGKFNGVEFIDGKDDRPPIVTVDGQERPTHTLDAALPGLGFRGNRTEQTLAELEQRIQSQAFLDIPLYIAIRGDAARTVETVVQRTNEEGTRYIPGQSVLERVDDTPACGYRISPAYLAYVRQARESAQRRNTTAMESDDGALFGWSHLSRADAERERSDREHQEPGQQERKHVEEEKRRQKRLAEANTAGKRASKARSRNLKRSGLAFHKPTEGEVDGVISLVKLWRRTGQKASNWKDSRLVDAARNHAALYGWEDTDELTRALNEIYKDTPEYVGS